MNVFIFGVGYTGLALAHAIQRRWPNKCTISGTCRTKEKAEHLQRTYGVDAFKFDVDDDYAPLGGAAVERLKQATHVISTLPAIADFNRDPVLEFHRGDLATSDNLRWAGYLSTTGVYGDHHGEWVTEER